MRLVVLVSYCGLFSVFVVYLWFFLIMVRIVVYNLSGICCWMGVVEG